jgi:hypothetical protein
MSALADFKKALQSLTTTVVKAEVAQESQGSSSDAFELQRAASAAERRLLRETHAALVAELSARAPGAALPHATWFAQTVARADALFGPEPV